MIPRPLRRAEVRDVDRIAIDEFGISGLVLMENAGRGAADEIARRFARADICILCGKGNNAGDGYVIARHLELAQSPDRGEAAGSVRIVSLADPAELAGDAAVNQAIAQRAGIAITVAADAASLAQAISTPDVIVDCLLGTGASGNPREPFAAAIAIANALPAKRIAIDLPSGLDCDSGTPGDPTLVADLTLTFVAAKIGFAAAAARAVLGELVVIPIGVPLRLLSRYR